METAVTRSKKKCKNSSRTKVRGAKRSLIRLKAADINQQQDTSIVKDEKNNNGVYEDLMVFVKGKKITNSTRGRQRKGVPKQIAIPSNSKSPSALEVIYLPPVSQRPVENIYWRPPISLSQQCPQVVMKTNRSYKAHLRPQPYFKQTLLRSNTCPQSVLDSSIHFRSVFKEKPYSQPVSVPISHPQTVLLSNSFSQNVLGLNHHSQTLKTAQEAPATATSQEASQEKQTETSYFPDDLQELLGTIDGHLASQHVHLEELTSWLKTPISLESSTLPQSVRKIHQLVEEWDDTEENKLQYFSNCLQEDFQTTPPTVIPPKVVVESQPNASQHCGVWSSMSLVD